MKKISPLESQQPLYPDLWEGDAHTFDTFDVYLREASQARLLSAEEEITLANAVQAAIAAEQQLAAPAIDEAERRRLQHEVVAGNEARRKLVRSNMRLVISIAKRYRGRGVPFLDLIQEGNIGLMSAIERFDPSLGYRFSTYATWWIRQAGQRAIVNQGRTIRLPAHIHDKLRRMHRVSAELEGAQQQRPHLEDVAVGANISTDEALQLQQYEAKPLSLQKPVGDDGETDLGDLIAVDETSYVDDEIDQRWLEDELDSALSALAPREAQIVRLRNGLDGNPPRTLRQVGTYFGISRERVRQIERDTYHKLRLILHQKHWSYNGYIA